MIKASDVLAYTCTYGDRQHISDTVTKMRAFSGMWFDWAVWAGNPSEEASALLTYELEKEDRTGIQRLCVWPENRGQHHATMEALALAKEMGYTWLLRVDDDILPRTKRWLKKMVERLEELKALAKDPKRRIVAAPKIVGLQNPLTSVGKFSLGQKFSVDAMNILGGGCRLHPVEILEDFKPNLYAPLGRRDPEQIAQHLAENEGMMIRFPDIRVQHYTTRLEAKDSPEQAHLREMGKLWCYLGPGMEEPA